MSFATILAGQDFFPTTSTHSSTNESVEIKVTDANGQEKLLKEVLSDGKHHVISIMASWCAPCRIELDALQKVYQRWDQELNTGVLALSIDKPSDTKKLFDMVSKNEWEIPIYHEKMAYTARELMVFGIPQVFLVNSKGEITYRSKGYKVSLVDILEKEIGKLEEK